MRLWDRFTVRRDVLDDTGAAQSLREDVRGHRSDRHTVAEIIDEQSPRVCT